MVAGLLVSVYGSAFKRAVFLSESLLPRSGVTSKTAPAKNAGAEVPHRTFAGYSATTSQRMPLRWQQRDCELGNCWRNSFCTRCSLSQNWTARGSDSRAMMKPLGFDQSVGSMGSQTTSTRTGSEGFCFSSCSIAEDPRKQYAQVGDSRSTRRFRSAALLNSRLNSSSLVGVSDVSGG